MALYQKMSGEQSKFEDWLLAQPKEEVLNHAYDAAVREFETAVRKITEAVVLPQPMEK